MVNAIVLFAFLFGTWIVMSGFFSPFFLGLGLFTCLLAVFIARKMTHETGEIRSIWPTILGMPKYLVWLEWEIIKSAVDVSIKMWQIEPDVFPAIAWVPTKQKDDIGVVTFANSITLTPGTVSVSVREDMIQVHALNEEGLEDLRQGKMDQKVFEAMGYEGPE